MKNRILPMTLVASAGLLTGCAHNSEYTSSSDRSRADQARYPKQTSGTYATATTPAATSSSTSQPMTSPSGTSSTRGSTTTVASTQSPTNEWYDTDRDTVMSPSGEVREFDRSGERTVATTTSQPSTPSTTSSQPVTSSSTTRSSTTPAAQPSATYTSSQPRDPNRATDQYGSSDHSGPAPTDTTATRTGERSRTDTPRTETTKTEVVRTDTTTAQPSKTTEYSKTETTDMRYSKDDAKRTSQPSRDTRTAADRTRSDDWGRRDRDAGRYREVGYTPVVKTNDAFGSSPYSPANMGRTTAEYDPRGIEPITREGVAVAPASAAQPATTWVVDSDSHDTRGSAPYTPANRGMNTAAEDVQTASVPVTGTMTEGRATTSDGRVLASTSTEETRRRHVEAMANQPATQQGWTNQPSQPIDPGRSAVATAQPERPGADRVNPSGRTVQPDKSAQPMTDAFAGATAETRILSILQAKDQEEIEIGKLAQQRGKSEAVRQYGETLTRDHSEHLEKVRSTAQSSGVTLLTAEQTKAAMKLEKERRPELYGMPMTDKDMKPVDKDGKPQWDDTHKDPGDVRKEQPATSDPTRTNPDRTNPAIREGGSPRQDGRDSVYGKDLVEELRAAEGDRFDALFAEKMHKGHGKVIRIVEDAQTKVTDPAVRDLLTKTLPTLREHERMASQLMSSTTLPGETRTQPPAGQQPTSPR